MYDDTFEPAWSICGACRTRYAGTHNCLLHRRPMRPSRVTVLRRVSR